MSRAFGEPMHLLPEPAVPAGHMACQGTCGLSHPYTHLWSLDGDTRLLCPTCRDKLRCWETGCNCPSMEGLDECKAHFIASYVSGPEDFECDSVKPWFPADVAREIRAELAAKKAVLAHYQLMVEAARAERVSV